MNRKYFLYLTAFAAACLLLILFTVLRPGGSPIPDDDPELPAIHSTAPFKTYISAIGIVEPSSDNINIGVSINRVLKKILVAVGTQVQVGTPLFIMENKDLKAELAAQQAAYKSAVVEHEKLKMLHPETLEAAKAAFDSATLALEETKAQNDMVQGLQNNRTLSLEEINRRRFAYLQAKNKWIEAKANFEKSQEKIWNLDLALSHLTVAQAKANMERVAAELERTIIRSPINGNVLQIRGHVGELPSLDPFRAPIMILGAINELHLRVSINQYDLPFFNPKAAAAAFCQGYSSDQYHLELVQIEPILVDKRTINNDVMEKVDTYVLQAIYKIKNGDLKNNCPLYVGQKMDVFIEADYTHEIKNSEKRSIK